MAIETILFSRLPQKSDRGGGCKRECQISEILASLNVHHLTYEDSKWFKNPLSAKSFNRLRLAKRLNLFAKYWHPFYHDYILRMLATTKDWKKIIKKNQSLKLALVDDPLFFYPLVNFLNRKKIPIVALCQNIESLSYSQMSPKHQLKLFKKEIGLLKKCALVATISREETFLLRNFNIPASFLPYYPIAEVERRLLDIRKKRQLSKKKGFLLLGNVWNKVTLEGMKRLIEYWSEEKIRQDLLVAGFGTPTLLKKSGHEKIRMLGELTGKDLDKLLIEVKGMICYQDFGSGALTKIQEMLIAGVPVIANPHAARSYNSAKGLWQFQELHHLGNTLKKINKSLNDLPPRPVKPKYQDFLTRIQQVSAKG